MLFILTRDLIVWSQFTLRQHLWFLLFWITHLIFIALHLSCACCHCRPCNYWLSYFFCLYNKHSFSSTLFTNNYSALFLYTINWCFSFYTNCVKWKIGELTASEAMTCRTALEINVSFDQFSKIIVEDTLRRHSLRRWKIANCDRLLWFRCVTCWSIWRMTRSWNIFVTTVVEILQRIARSLSYLSYINISAIRITK